MSQARLPHTLQLLQCCVAAAAAAAAAAADDDDVVQIITAATAAREALHDTMHTVKAVQQTQHYLINQQTSNYTLCPCSCCVLVAVTAYYICCSYLITRTVFRRIVTPTLTQDILMQNLMTSPLSILHLKLVILPRVVSGVHDNVSTNCQYIIRDTRTHCDLETACLWLLTGIKTHHCALFGGNLSTTDTHKHNCAKLSQCHTHIQRDTHRL